METLIINIHTIIEENEDSIAYYTPIRRISKKKNFLEYLFFKKPEPQGWKVDTLSIQDINNNNIIHISVTTYESEKKLLNFITKNKEKITANLEIDNYCHKPNLDVNLENLSITNLCGEKIPNGIADYKNYLVLASQRKSLKTHRPNLIIQNNITTEIDEEVKTNGILH